MDFRINFTTEAWEQALAGARYISHAGSPDAAAAWLAGLIEAVESLRALPHRYPLAKESRYFRGVEIRERAFKSHRVLYTVRDDVVHILHVRHAARQDLDQD